MNEDDCAAISRAYVYPEVLAMTVQLQPLPCLWCKARRYQASVEHVFPEALGCAPTYVLETGVCRLCNNRFGRLDMALVSQFELPAWMAGTPRKGGRPPSVDSWAPLATRLGQNGPELYVNAGPGDMMVSGKRLKPASPATGVTDAAFEVHGAEATARFSLPIGRDPLFLRALYKTALNVLAQQEGLETSAGAGLAPARTFVMNGTGDFSALLVEFDAARERVPFAASIWRRPASFPAIALTFFGTVFLTDLDPAQPLLAELQAGLQREAGETSWACLTPSPPKRKRSRVAG